MQVVSPRTEDIPDVRTNDPSVNKAYVATLPAGSIISWGWTSGAQSGGSDDFDADLFDISNPAAPVALRPGSQLWSVTSSGASYSVTLSAAASIGLLCCAGGGAGHHSTGTLFGFFADVELAAGGICAYGTRAQGPTTAGIIVTTALIDILAVVLKIPPWITVAFDAFIGKTLWAGDLCAGLPPEMPVFTNADFIGGVPNVADPTSRDKFWTALLAAAWPSFCECIPGPPLSADPIPPLVPSPTKPDAAPAGPIIIDCDGTDICTQLNALARQLVGISGQIAQLRSDVTLIQRQKVPFAYLAGALHTGLSGNGQFAVQDILGLAVQVTTVPGASGEEAGDPIARFGLGWVATGTANGWRRSVPIRANPQWVDAEPDDTLVGYSFQPLVVANIEEFVREP